MTPPRGRRNGGRVPAPDLAPSRTDEVITAVLRLEREAGTPEAADARRLLSDHFQALGFRVEVQRFVFSTGTLAALPVFGAGLGWITVITLPLLLLQGAPAWGSVTTWVIGLVALGLIVAGIALGWAPARGDKREDANLIVRRPDAQVDRWIVAHVDTKAQRQSMAGRLVALGVTAVAVLLMTGMAVVRLWFVPPTAAVAGVAGLVLAASVLAARARLRGRTVGARDNGSGLVAALVAAETCDERTGFIFTGAEEFGLVGARILAQQTPELVRGRDVINLDTIDDTGDVAVVTHDRHGAELAERLAALLQTPEHRVRRRRLPPGIMVDSLALARAGARAVTVARLDWGTLRIIHTPRDSNGTLALATARWIGAAIARPR